jgi:hypothetical protein
VETVKKHVSHILGKLDAANRTQRSPSPASWACSPEVAVRPPHPAEVMTTAPGWRRVAAFAVDDAVILPYLGLLVIVGVVGRAVGAVPTDRCSSARGAPPTTGSRAPS